MGRTPTPPPFFLAWWRPLGLVLLAMALALSLIPSAGVALADDTESSETETSPLIDEESVTQDVEADEAAADEGTSDDSMEASMEGSGVNALSLSNSEALSAKVLEADITYSGVVSGGAAWSVDPETNTLTFSATEDTTVLGQDYDYPWQSYLDTSEVINVVISEGITEISMEDPVSKSEKGITLSLPSTLKSISSICFPLFGIISIENNGCALYDEPFLYGDEGRTQLYAVVGIAEMDVLVVPEGVTYLAYGSLCGGASLSSLYLPATLETCDTSALSGWYEEWASTVAYISVDSGNTAYYVNNDPTSSDYGCLMNSSGFVVIRAEGESTTDEYGVTYSLDRSILISVPSTLEGSYEVLDGCTIILSYAFQDCTALESITLTDSVTFLGDYAFQNCTSLKSITLPDSVTSLGDYAFNGCTSLETVVLSSGLTSIGASTFRNCISLSDITIPDTVETIGPYCFYSCTSLESIDLPDSITSIGVGAFANTGLTSFVVPSSLWSTVSDYSSFSSDSDLVTGTAALFTTTAAKNFALPLNEAVYSGITSIDLSNYEQTYIPAYMFMGLNQLSEVSIPSTIQDIGTGAFFECTSLKDVYIYNQNVSIAGAGTTGDSSLGWTSDAYAAFSRYVWDDSATEHSLLEKWVVKPMTGINFYGLAYSSNDLITYAEDNDCNFIPFVILGDYDATELFGYEITGYNNIVIEDMTYTGQALTPVVKATFTDVDLTDMVRVLSDDDACSVVYKDANGNTVSEIVAAGTYTAEITGDNKSVFGTTTISFSVVDPNAVQTSASSDSDDTTATIQLAQTGDRVDVTQPLAALAVGALFTTLVAACALSRRTHYRKG